jgi:DNA-directed RNA polymerase specialized sigma24 family protein
MPSPSPSTKRSPTRACASLARGALGHDAVEDVVQETLLAVVRQRPAARPFGAARGGRPTAGSGRHRARARRDRLERGPPPEATASTADVAAREGASPARAASSRWTPSIEMRCSGTTRTSRR